jgi:uncharacterized protein (TIGR03083 family)
LAAVEAALDPDPAPAEAIALTSAVDAATSRLRASLAALSDEQASAPSLLKGWSRASILAHLAYVATASLRMTNDALAGRQTTMYPGGPAERDDSVLVGPDDSAETLVTRVDRASTALSERWLALEPDQWATSLVEDRLGQMRLARLVAMRLTEVEVHHADLAVGYAPHDWSTDFTRRCLPLRFAWLAAHHRNRRGADRSVDGRWLFVCRPERRGWLVEAHGCAVAVRSAAPDEPADTVLTGAWTDVLAFLLGRQSVHMLGITGDAGRAAAFKRAFPGP